MKTHEYEHDAPMDDLERSLAGMTAWDENTINRGTGPGGPPVHIWETAWEQAHPRSAATRHTGGRLTRPLPSRWFVAAGGVVVALLLVAMILPSLHSARRVGRYDESVNVQRTGESKMDHVMALTAPDAAYIGGGVIDSQVLYSRRAVPQTLAQPSESDVPPSSSADRHVIRTAQIELKAPDVAAVFLTVPSLLDRSAGEYAENSTLAGQDEQMYGRVTLRVRADRLEAVLASLRGLGEVLSESTGDDDVTDKVVDLEATLRNERRIETELLELIAARADADLEDVLKVRESLREVRERIEKLTAQRDQIGRQIALATITVSIRSTLLPKPPAEQTFVSYLSDEAGQSWRIGLLNLADTAAWVIRVAVGGLILWVPLLILAAGAFLYRRRVARKARLAMEGTPTE